MIAAMRSIALRPSWTIAALLLVAGLAVPTSRAAAQPADLSLAVVPMVAASEEARLEAFNLGVGIVQRLRGMYAEIRLAETKADQELADRLPDPADVSKTYGVRFVFSVRVSKPDDNDHHADVSLYDAVAGRTVWVQKFISTEDFPLAWPTEITGRLVAKIKETAA